jgi:hypothetical protein
VACLFVVIRYEPFSGFWFSFINDSGWDFSLLRTSTFLKPPLSVAFEPVV